LVILWMSLVDVADCFGNRAMRDDKQRDRKHPFSFPSRFHSEGKWGRVGTGLGWGEEAQNMCTLHAVGISELSCNYLMNRPTRSFVRSSRGRHSFLLGCRDVPQYKVMKYLVFGVISSLLEWRPMMVPRGD
jgi:hypothetical protein